jgi:DNA polymerase-3 subunit gamma/tau
LLVELALVRVARLENLTELSNLVERLAAVESGNLTPPRVVGQNIKKKLSPVDFPVVHEAGQRELVQAPPRKLELPDSRQALDDSSAPSERREQRAEGMPPRASQEPAPGASGLADLNELEAKNAAAPPPLASAGLSQPSEMTSLEPTERGELPPLELEAVRKVWPELVKKVGATLGMKLVSTEAVRVDGSDVLVIAAKPGYNSLADACGSDDARAKVEQALGRLLQRHVSIRYERSAASDQPNLRSSHPEPRTAELLAQDSLVQRIVELFEARQIHLEYEDEPDPA